MECANAEMTHRENVIILEELVVATELACVLASYRHGNSRISDFFYGLNVVPVAVGLYDLAHAEGRRHLEKPLMLIGGVDEQGIARGAATNDIHVVFDRSHHEAVDLDRGIRPDQGDISHSYRLPERGTGRFSLVSQE
jgi:hypothetical protein